MSLASLNVFDWVLIALLVYSTVRAFLRGLLLEIFSLLGLVLGILLASWNYKAFSILLSRWITSQTTSQIVAFLLILMGVTIACGLAGRILRSSASVIGLGFVDRLLGVVFGLARGCLFGVALMMLLAAFGPKPAWVKNSQLAPYFLAGAHAVSFVVPHELEQQIAKGAVRLKHNTPQWINQPE